MCKMIISPGIFSFLKILIFWVVRGVVKGQKMVQNWSILSRLISQEPFSRLFFHFLKILIFWVGRRVSGQKIAENDIKLSVAPYISGTTYHMIFIYGWYTRVKGYLQQCFTFFPNFSF